MAASEASEANDVLGWASAHQVAAAIRRRDISVAEVIGHQLDRIQRYDARLRSVVTLDADGARRRAAEADDALARGQALGPLRGIGITVEDHHATARMRSTFGGYRPFAENVPAADATLVARLKRANPLRVRGEVAGHAGSRTSSYPAGASQAAACRLRLGEREGVQGLVDGANVDGAVDHY